MASLRRRRRIVAAMRAGYRVAYWLVWAWCAVLRPHQRGVKCVVRAGDGRVLFVRHSYGDQAAWELPGGRAKRSEPAADAARREAREELGVDLESWRDVGTVEGTWTGARLELTCLQAELPGGAVLDPDPVELQTCAWHALDDPPRPLGPVTLAAMPLVLAGADGANGARD